MTQARARSRASAKSAGSRHERVMADYLKQWVSEFIDRRVKTGSKDRGDLAGLRAHGQRLVAELKNTRVMSVGPHLKEAEIERGNDDALAGFVIYKRHGIADPGEQVVVMTVRDFIAILTGVRPD